MNQHAFQKSVAGIMTASALLTATSIHAHYVEEMPLRYCPANPNEPVLRSNFLVFSRTGDSYNTSAKDENTAWQALQKAKKELKTQWEDYAYSTNSRYYPVQDLITGENGKNTLPSALADRKSPLAETFEKKSDLVTIMAWEEMKKPDNISYMPSPFYITAAPEDLSYCQNLKARSSQPQNLPSFLKWILKPF